jgi:hypothetical protein
MDQEEVMTYEEFESLWGSLDEDQKDSVRIKAKWEHMTLWAVCNDWPNIWADERRLRGIRVEHKTTGRVVI